MEPVTIEHMQQRLRNVPEGQLQTVEAANFAGKPEDGTAHKSRAVQEGLNGIAGGCELIPLPGGKGRVVTCQLYPGMTLSFVDYLADEAPCRHGADSDVLEVSYCRHGRAGWPMGGGSVYLGPGDICIHTRALCAGSAMGFPNGYYSGITLCVDVGAPLPPLLRESGVTAAAIRDKLCGVAGFTALPGSERTDPIFNGFYGIPAPLREAYFKLKTQELLLYLHCLDRPVPGSPYPPEQVELIRQVHSRLTQTLDRRMTIEELSRQFPMNPSAMKALFKAVYGNSIAAHVREHRMERAAQLLRDTDQSVALIARAVGYDSHSKFSAEFKKTYQMLPTEYRRAHRY